jgi:hypothetical protein
LDKPMAWLDSVASHDCEAPEIRARKLVGGQRHCGLGIGHAQQRLGQPHQRQPFGSGQRVLAQQGFHREAGGLGGTRLLDPAHAIGAGTGPVQPVEAGQQGVEDVGFEAIRAWEPHD